MSFQEPYRVVGVELRTPTIIELWLRPLSVPLAYRPGEYVLLEDPAGDVPPRSYSIANAPRRDALISLLVTRVPQGATSTWVHAHLKAGDEVGISGPYGTFVDEPASTAPRLYLAAGSGVAPMRALVEQGLRAGPRRWQTLIFSARTEADVIDRARFTALQSRDPCFRFIRTLTRAAGPPPGGRIPSLLPEIYDRLGEHDVFIAGAPGFVLACAGAAEALGAMPERIKTEEFFAEGPPGQGAARPLASST
jgi:CDP-4-dehydro-6-deoxyglucose reductase